jgi:5-methylcytosine-specific restriction protein A
MSPSRRPCLGPGGFHLSEPGESRCAAHAVKGWTNTKGLGAGWALLRRDVLAQEPRCRSCGARATTVDHIQPRAFGGSDSRANLQPLCDRCHRAKTQRESHDGMRRKRAGIG